MRDFLSGITVPYTHPVPYFMLAVGLFAVSFRFMGGTTGAADSDRLFVILVVPFVAASSRLIAWQTRRNFAEHLIALLYLSGHALVLATFLVIGTPLVGDRYVMPYSLSALGLVLGYFLWAYARVFFDRLWIGALAGLGSLVAGTAAWAVSVIALVAVLRR